jgi:hypothetical protein
VPDSDDSLTVTGVYTRDRVANDAAGAPQATRESVSASALSLSVVLDDTHEPAVDYDSATGAFSFARASADQGYRLSLTFDGSTTDFQIALPHVEFRDAVIGRADPAPVTQPTLLTFDLGQEAAPIAVMSTGTWSNSGFATEPPDFTYDWRTAPAAAPPAVGLLDGAAGDRLYVAQATTTLGGSDGPPYTAITSVATFAPTLQDGVALTLGSDYEVTPPTCATIATRNVEEIARFAQDAAGSDTTTYVGEWGAFALPDAPLSVNGELLLASAADGAAPTDATNTASFAAPVPGALFVSFVTALGRTVQSTAGSFELAAVASRYWLPIVRGADCATNTVPAPPVTGVPYGLALGGVDLSTADVAAPFDPDADATLTWQVDGPADAFAVGVYEIDDTGGAPVQTLVRTIVTLTPTAVVPAETFRGGYPYLISVAAIVGESSSGSGVFGPFDYPLGVVTTFSYVIRATPQSTERARRQPGESRRSHGMYLNQPNAIAPPAAAQIASATSAMFVCAARLSWSWRARNASSAS